MLKVPLHMEMYCSSTVIDARGDMCCVVVKTPAGSSFSRYPETEMETLQAD